MAETMINQNLEMKKYIMWKPKHYKWFMSRQAIYVVSSFEFNFLEIDYNIKMFYVPVKEEWIEINRHLLWMDCIMNIIVNVEYISKIHV
jgi:hypothetical protein